MNKKNYNSVKKCKRIDKNVVSTAIVRPDLIHIAGTCKC